jgi:predicted enzyme related to lactoylglutathione lyase
MVGGMPQVDLVEFPSSSAAQSGDFFARVFGWTAAAYGGDYLDVTGGGVSLGFQSDETEQPAAPLVVIGVDDLDEARAAIEAAGGVITTEPFEFPGGVRLHFREPGGNELAVWTPARPSGA